MACRLGGDRSIQLSYGDSFEICGTEPYQTLQILRRTRSTFFLIKSLRLHPASGANSGKVELSGAKSGAK